MHLMGREGAGGRAGSFHGGSTCGSGEAEVQVGGSGAQAVGGHMQKGIDLC